jgi:hypothetical protein
MTAHQFLHSMHAGQRLLRPACRDYFAFFVAAALPGIPNTITASPNG